MESQLLGNSPSFDDAVLNAATGLGSFDDLDEEAKADLELDQLNEFGVIGLDYEASEAIFNDRLPLKRPFNFDDDEEEEGPENEDECNCLSCQERLFIENEHYEELERLRKCWYELREDAARVYKMVLDGSWNEAGSCRPDLAKTKERVHKLCWRDPHQLFQRLETGVKEFVLEIKLKLIELLQQQAKNPSLAEDFIQGTFHNTKMF